MEQTRELLGKQILVETHVGDLVWGCVIGVEEHPMIVRYTVEGQEYVFWTTREQIKRIQ